VPDGLTRPAGDSKGQPVAIIGGGPAGMTAAWELVRAGQPCVVIERQRSMGGLARTLEYELPGVGTFRSDIGPHRFLSHNPFLYHMIEDILGEHWLRLHRKTRFHVGDRRFQYPPRLGDSLSGLGFTRAIRATLDLAGERLRDLGGRAEPLSFEDFVVRRFGRTLAEFNMLNYTEKIWGIPCDRISPDWAAQRIEGLTVRAIVRQLLAGRDRAGTRSMTQTFNFPDQGSGLTYESMRRRIEATGLATVIDGAEIDCVRHGAEGIEGVEYLRDGVRSELACRQVISTMLLTDLVTALRPGPDEATLATARSLRYRSQVYVFLMIDKPRITDDTWMYFPDHAVPFGRFHEPRNFSPKMSPDGATSLWLEHFVFTGDGTWQADPAELATRDIEWLVKLGYLEDRRQVLGFRSHRERDVYPIYDLDYRRRLEPVMRWLERLPGLYLAGRGARFRYTNQDHSMEMGILAAQSILRGEHLDIGRVASGREYFEQGYTPLRPTTGQ